MSRLMEVLFGCNHKRYTFPITAKNKRHLEAAKMTGIYVVCLDCGKEFPYDWHRMKMMSGPKDRPEEITEAAGEALKPVA